MRNKQHLAWAAALLLAIPASSMATNGYFSHGYGTKSKGLAGGGIALPQDAMAAATNPAGMVWVGDRMDLGAALFSPHREYTADTGAFNVMGGNHDSDNTLFLIPHFAWNYMLDENSSYGVTVYGNGGMNTEYTNQGGGVFFAGTAGVDLSQLFVNLSYARKFNGNASWGASLILAAQAFKAYGLGTFAGFVANPPASDLTDNGHDISYGAGLKFGIQGEIANGLTLAGSYQSKIRMSEFDDYKDLFAEDGDFDIPATATIGLAWKAAPNHTLTFDVQRIWYGSVDSIANPMGDLFNCPALGGADQESCLGGNNGAGFGWDDMTVYKLGWQYQPNNLWTVRLGYSYGKQPIDSDDVTFNILAPGVMEQHYTIGFTRKMGKDQELNFAAMYSPRESVHGTNPFSGGAQNVEIEMYQYEVELSYSWLF